MDGTLCCELWVFPWQRIAPAYHNTNFHLWNMWQHFPRTHPGSTSHSASKGRYKQSLMVFNEGMLIIQAQHPIRQQQCNINHSQPRAAWTDSLYNPRWGSRPSGPSTRRRGSGLLFEGKGICVKPGHLIMSHLSMLSTLYKYYAPTKKALCVWFPWGRTCGQIGG